MRLSVRTALSRLSSSKVRAESKKARLSGVPLAINSEQCWYFK